MSCSELSCSEMSCSELSVAKCRYPIIIGDSNVYHDDLD